MSEESRTGDRKRLDYYSYKVQLRSLVAAELNNNCDAVRLANSQDDQAAMSALKQVRTTLREVLNDLDGELADLRARIYGEE